MANDHVDPSGTCRRSDWTNRSPVDIIHLNTYDFMAYLGKRVINPGGLQGRDQVLDRLKLAPGDRVLEIGGGNGHAACAIAKKYRCHITSIDISQRSVEEANERIAREGLTGRVQSHVGDVHDLEFKNAAFDAVFSQAVIMFVDQDRALAEISRVLKPRGVFGGLEFCWKNSPPAEVQEKTYAICGCKTLNFHTHGEWTGKLRRAGFIRVKGEEHPFGLLSIRGFLRDEGLGNCLKIAGKVISCRASRTRMSEIWNHFSGNVDYFSYVVLSGEKMQVL